MRPAKVKIAKAPEIQKNGSLEAGKLSNDNNKGKELGNDENKEENKE